MNNNKAQQEIVGFVLIVVVVMIALMVYLGITLRSSSGEIESVEAENALNALMKHTTGCAINKGSDYDDFEDLFKDAYKDKTCSNLNEKAELYLKDYLEDVLTDVFESEASVAGYEITFSEQDDEGALTGIMMLDSGNCTGTIKSAQRSIQSGSDKLVVRLKICSI